MNAKVFQDDGIWDAESSAYAHITVRDKKIKAEVIGQDFNVRISKLTGDITSIIFNKREFLVDPLRLAFDTNEANEDIENDGMNSVLFKLLKDIGRKEKQLYSVSDVHIDHDDKEAVITVFRKVKRVKELMRSTYRVTNTGDIYIEHILTPKKDIYRFGTTMTLGQGYCNFVWNMLQENVKGRKKKTIDKCKIINGEQSLIKKNKKTKFKIKARKSNVSSFNITCDQGKGLCFESQTDKLMSVRASAKTKKDDNITDSVLDFRTTGTLSVCIDYREKKNVEAIWGSENYEEEYKLKRNVTYSLAYKITRAR